MKLEWKRNQDASSPAFQDKMNTIYFQDSVPKHYGE